jgi:zinc protease
VRLFVALLVALPGFGLPLYRDSLDNGLIVMTYEDHRAPAVSLRFVCRSGAAFDTEGQSGTAGIVTGLILAGTPSLDADSIAATLEFIGARADQGTGYDCSWVDIRALSGHFDLVLGLLADGARNAAFPDEEFERQRAGVLTSALRGWDSPARAAGMLFDRRFFGQHPYARPAWGDTADLARLTANAVRGFHRTHWRPNNCFLVVVGDVKRSEAVAGAGVAFAGWDPAPIPALEPPSLEPVAGLRATLTSRPDLNQSYVVMGHPGLSAGAADMLAARLMSYVLGGSAITSRLGQSVRVEAGLAYDVRCWFERNRLPGAFKATVQTSSPAEAIRRMRAEFTRMHDSGPTVEETRTAKEFYTGSFPLGYSDTPGKLHEVTTAEVHGLGPGWLEEFPERVRALSRDDLARAARERLSPDDLLILVYGPATRAELNLEEAEWLE